MAARAVINFAKGHPPDELLPNGLIAEGFVQITDALLANTNSARDVPSSQQKQQQQHGTASSHRHLLQYCSGRGASAFRDKLARFITRQAADGVAARPELLLSTNGVSHGLDLVASSLASPGDTVLVENPCYFLSADIFRDHHLNVVPLPLKRAPMEAGAERGGGGGGGGGGSEGGASFCVSSFERLLDTHPKARLVYLVPTNCNPTGHTLSTEGRVSRCS